LTQAFTELHIWLQTKMSMSHIYQPVFLKALLENGGVVSIDEIAKTIVGFDTSQIEYYCDILKRWPEKTLKSHGLIERERGKDVYSLTEQYNNLTLPERQQL
jgi:ATP adenylyltransferase